LPAPSNEEVDIAESNTGEYQLPNSDTEYVRSLPLRRGPSLPPPAHPLGRLHFFWHKDPAYKVLMIAVTSVLLAGLVLVTLTTRAFLQNVNFLNGTSSYSQMAPTNVTPSGTIDLKPTFAPPSGGQGSMSSSQPPQSAPFVQPTNPAPQPQPSPSPQPGQLSVQITSAPASVQNNSIVYIGVYTSEPNVEVQLNIIYTVPPYRSIAGPRMTGGRGNAFIQWGVSVYLFGHHAQAMIVAVATDQNGASAQSQPTTIQITGRGRV
jgi:hypothetical protein